MQSKFVKSVMASLLSLALCVPESIPSSAVPPKRPSSTWIAQCPTQRAWVQSCLKPMCPGQTSWQLQFSKRRPLADHGGGVRGAGSAEAVIPAA